MAAPKNLYHRRLVADSAAKSCWICYKPSSTVLITPDQDDWFHVCAGHLSDSKFAIAKDADDIAERKRKEALDKEIAEVKKEFEEKMRKKLARREQKEYEKDGKKKDESKEKESKAEDEKAEKEKEEKLKELEAKKDPGKGEKTVIDGPRIFELQKSFFNMRLQKKRDAEMARKAKERMRSNPFPAVPKGDLGVTSGGEDSASTGEKHFNSGHGRSRSRFSGGTERSYGLLLVNDHAVDYARPARAMLASASAMLFVVSSKQSLLHDLSGSLLHSSPISSKHEAEPSHTAGSHIMTGILSCPAIWREWTALTIRASSQRDLSASKARKEGADVVERSISFRGVMIHPTSPSTSSALCPIDTAFMWPLDGLDCIPSGAMRRQLDVKRGINLCLGSQQ